MPQAPQKPPATLPANFSNWDSTPATLPADFQFPEQSPVLSGPVPKNMAFSAPKDTRSFWQKLFFPGDLTQLEDIQRTVHDYMTRGKPPAVADFQGGIVTGPLELAHAGAIAFQHPVRAAHEAIEGAGKTVAFPSALASPSVIAASPSGFIRMLAGGYLGGQVGSKGAEMLGADPETQQLAGDLGNLAGGYTAVSGAPRAVLSKGAGAVADTARNNITPQQAQLLLRLLKPKEAAIGLLEDIAKPSTKSTTIAGTAEEAIKPVSGPGKYAHKEVDELTTPVRRPVNEVPPQEDIPAVQTHEPPVPNAQPVSMEGFYGKTKQKSNLKANQRQLASPTASTAPGQTTTEVPAPESALPRSIMDIMTKPGLSDADLRILQDFNAHLKPAAPGMAGMKNYSTIGQITGQPKTAAASAKASQGAAAPLSPLLQRGFEAVRDAEARIAAQPNTYVRSVTQRPGFGTAKVPVEQQQSPKIKVRRKQAGR